MHKVMRPRAAGGCSGKCIYTGGKRNLPIEPRLVGRDEGRSKLRIANIVVD